jgi:glycosyltransferase involved in cell wall biosynthesis
MANGLNPCTEKMVGDVRVDMETASHRREPRLLFVTWTVLGFSTYARELADYSATREDVETVHRTLRLRGLQRIYATARVHGHGDLHHAVRRRRALCRSDLASLRTLLDTNAFTAVHFTPAGLSDLVRRAGVRIPYSVGLDTTVALQGDGQNTNTWLLQCDGELYRRAAFLAPMSKQAANSLEMDFGISPDRLLLSPPAVDMDLFATETSRAIPPRLLFVGNDWQRKGGPALLGWYRRHLEGRCELHVVGDVPTPRHSPKGVVFHGPVPRVTLAHRLLPSATALVLPSRVEMTPWVVVEAAAAQVPVIASAVGAVGEMVRDGETGFLLRPNHAEEDFVRAADMLLSDSTMRARMGRAAQANARAVNSREVVLGRLFERLMSL